MALGWWTSCEHFAYFHLSSAPLIQIVEWWNRKKVEIIRFQFNAILISNNHPHSSDSIFCDALWYFGWCIRFMRMKRICLNYSTRAECGLMLILLPYILRQRWKHKSIFCTDSRICMHEIVRVDASCYFIGFEVWIQVLLFIVRLAHAHAHHQLEIWKWDFEHFEVCSVSIHSLSLKENWLIMVWKF